MGIVDECFVECGCVWIGREEVCLGHGCEADDCVELRPVCDEVREDEVREGVCNVEI